MYFIILPTSSADFGLQSIRSTHQYKSQVYIKSADATSIIGMWPGYSILYVIEWKLISRAVHFHKLILVFTIDIHTSTW